MWWQRDNDEEDPFASLREGTAGTASSRPKVADHAHISGVPGAKDEPASNRQPGSKAPKRRRGSDVLLVLLLIAVSLGASAAVIVRGERAASDAPRAQADPAPGEDPVPDDPTPADSDDEAAASPPRRYDLVRPQGMRRALRVLGRSMNRGELVDLLRVAPDRINARVHAQRSGRQRWIDVTDELTASSRAFGETTGSGVRLAQIQAGAPWRAARNAARRGGFPVRRLDYIVLSASLIAGSKPTWSLFFDGVGRDDGHWIASLDGRVVYRPGEQPGSGTTTSSSTLSVTRNGVRTDFSGAQAERISRCIRAAGSDGAAIQRCLP